MLSHDYNVPFKNMYRIKGIKCVQVKDSCLFERVRIVFSRSPVVPLTLVMGPRKLTLNGFGVKFDPKVASRGLHITRLYAEHLNTPCFEASTSKDR